MVIYKEEMKENKSGTAKEFSKYLDAFMWLKGMPKFGIHFLKWHESFPNDILVGGDWSTLGFKSMGPLMKITRGPAMDMTKQKR